MRQFFKDLIDRVSKDSLYNYYVVENHTVKDTYNHFNISCSDLLYELLRYYNIKKPSPLDYLIERVSKEELIRYYIEEDHTYKETINKFGLGSFPQLQKVCNYYGIAKNESFESILNRISKEEIEDYYILQDHTVPESLIYFKLKEDSWLALLRYYKIRKERFKWGNFKSKPSKEILEDLYINKQLTLTDIESQYNISSSLVSRLLKEYNIPLREYAESVKIGKERKIKEVGSKEKYYKDINKKVKATLLARYGVDNSNYVPGAKEKRKSTNLLLYGVENGFQTQQCKEGLNKYKRSINNLSPSQANLPPEFQMLLSNKDKSVEFLKEFKDTTLEGLMKYFSCKSVTPIMNWIKKFDLKSFINYNYRGFEKEFADFLISLGIEVKDSNRNCRKILGNGQELDFYFPSNKIAIELNGDYWHSSLQKPKKYHFEKSKLAEEKGIRLIYIWWYEWQDIEKREKLISLLKIAFNIVPSKIYARNCEIKQITNKEAKPFNEANHLQGHRNAQVTYGLFYQGNLVQLMSFSKTKYNRNLKGDNNWEIIRGCPGSNNIVVGGVSKLFSHFIKDYNPDSVFSYCDFNKFDGKGYEAIGMKFIGYTGPDMSWVLSFNPTITISRQPSKHKELKEKSIAQIWGSGSKKYIWVNNKIIC